MNITRDLALEQKQIILNWKSCWSSSYDFSNQDEIKRQTNMHSFPVRLAFAMTINKFQGETLGFVGIYLPSPVFLSWTAIGSHVSRKSAHFFKSIDCTQQRQ
jgi:hypothetical protein